MNDWANIRILQIAALVVSLVASADARSIHGGGGGFNGGRSQVNLNFVQTGGDFVFANGLLTAQGWSLGDNSGSPAANELDSNGYPLPGAGLFSHGGVSTVFFEPAIVNGGSQYVIPVTGKCTFSSEGTVVTKTISTATGGATTAVIDFGSAHNFTSGMEAPISGVSGTIAGSLNGNKFVVASTTTNTITITVGSSTTGLSGTGGTAAYGSKTVGVATGGRVIVDITAAAIPHNAGYLQVGFGISATDATTPCTKMAFVALRDEARYNADSNARGSDFLAKMREGNQGVFRDLNIANTNISTETTWATRKPQTYCSFQSGHYYAPIYAGTATGSGNDYSVTLGSGPPVDKTQVNMAMPAHALACSTGAASQLTFTGNHGMSAGDPFNIFASATGSLPVDSGTGSAINLWTGTSGTIIYYVKTVISPTVVTFALTQGGIALNLSSCGTATLFAQPTVVDQAVTFTNGSSTVLWTGHPSLHVNDPISCTGTSLPSNISDYASSYYVKSVIDANNITISATPGGTAITSSGSGSATNCIRQPTLALNGGTAYPIKTPGAKGLSVAGNRIPHARCFGINVCHGTATFDATLSVWLFDGAQDAAEDRVILAGWPPEVVLATAKELGMHVYYTLPPYTLDSVTDYLPSLVAYTKSYIATNAAWMIPRFEGSPNECWNGNFYGTAIGLAKSFVLWGAADYDQWCGKVASTSGQVVKAVYGGTPGVSYQTLQGVQTGPFSSPTNNPATRLSAAAYVSAAAVQSPLSGSWGTITFTATEAYKWVTTVVAAQYYSTAAENTSIPPSRAG
ncbi:MULTISPECIES: hypothetical protein [Bradyrhizobium]|uniref:Uncharacterized protein n=2 Tax=Bradyrhizobium TaxID=374 RepID=A0ABY0Q6R8_9BRAD|nr:MULTISPECIES: hypothetical protein [Bradyrhizobium]SDJ61815.1 hypothetical protein SAMN05444163_5936 [Bradyrhizobium ottawaense]SEC35704.1 hypothetical protein SAMN05444171_1221 [Bradyrhizobium lablabi]